ncbi:hypothetical protein GCM10027418_10320 [Mariniluteicoccus endophyticus]
MLPPSPAGRTGPTGTGPHTEADDAALAQAKDILRDAVRRRRAARPDTDRSAHDTARTQRVLEFLGDVDALRVACYLSVEPEPSTLELVGALTARGARVLLPVLRKEPDWAWYTGPDDLRAGWNDIPEPTGPRLGAEALAKVDVIVCSALAGSPLGDRLGVGGGWYDRARLHADPAVPVVALLNDDEVMPALPMQEWDLPVDVIITPTRTIRCA